MKNLQPCALHSAQELVVFGAKKNPEHNPSPLLREVTEEERLTRPNLCQADVEADSHGLNSDCL